MQKVSQKGQLPVKQLKSMRKKLQVFMGIIELFLALLSYFIELARTPPHSPALNRTIPPHFPALAPALPRAPPHSSALPRTPRTPWKPRTYGWIFLHMAFAAWNSQRILFDFRTCYKTCFRAVMASFAREQLVSSRFD